MLTKLISCYSFGVFFLLNGIVSIWNFWNWHLLKGTLSSSLQLLSWNLFPRELISQLFKMSDVFFLNSIFLNFCWCSLLSQKFWTLSPGHACASYQFTLHYWRCIAHLELLHLFISTSVSKKEFRRLSGHFRHGRALRYLYDSEDMTQDKWTALTLLEGWLENFNVQYLKC